MNSFLNSHGRMRKCLSYSRLRNTSMNTLLLVQIVVFLVFCFEGSLAASRVYATACFLGNPAIRQSKRSSSALESRVSFVELVTGSRTSASGHQNP